MVFGHLVDLVRHEVLLHLLAPEGDEPDEVEVVIDVEVIRPSEQDRDPFRAEVQQVLLILHHSLLTD